MASLESRADNADDEEETLLSQKPEVLPTVVEDDDGPLGDQPMLAIPPDGGYGWVIVAASFLANMMVDGIAYAYGILLIELVTYFEETKAKVSLVGSLLCGVYLSTGPIAAAFVQLYGCRKVTIVGSILSCLGLFLSIFATNVETLIFTYGVLGGFGFGLVYLPSTIIVNLYFESRRSLAVGIAVCGSGVGAVVFSPLMSFLMEIYDWKNTMLILAGLMLNCAVFGALYRPLMAPSSSKTAAGPSDAADNVSIGSRGSTKRRRGRSGGSLTGDADAEERRMAKASVGQADILNYIKRNREESENEAGNLHASDNITSQHSAPVRQRTRSDCPQQQRADSSIQLIRSTPNLGDVKRAVHRSRHPPAEMLLPLPRHVQKPEEYAKPMNRKDIFYAGSVFNMSRAGIASTANIAASNQLIGSWIMSMTRIPAEEEKEEGGGIRSCWQRAPRSLRNVIEQMTDFSLLKRPPYLFTWLANVLFMIGYYVPFFLLMDFAVLHNDIPQQQASFIVSAIGVANTLGRIFFGWLVSLPCITALFVNNSTIFAAGILTIFVPFCTTFPLMLAYGIGYGLLVAPIISLTSELLCDMLGIDKLTNAFGLLTLARGISSSVGPPFAGFLFDQTRRFDIPYFASGGIIALSAVVFCLLYLPPFRKQMQKNKRDFEEQMAAFVASTTALNHMDAHTSV